jgi:hypothetical protein
VSSQIPIQFSTEVELWGPEFRKVQICFTPMIRAGCDPELAYSYTTFIFKFRDSSKKPVEHYFMPRSRWTDQHFEEWKKVMALLPAGFDINHAFEQTTIDLVL